MVDRARTRRRRERPPAHVADGGREIAPPRANRQHSGHRRHAGGVTPDSVLGELEGLRALARSLVYGDADADDLLQDTAVAALQHPPADTGQRPVRSWLAAVLRNRWRMDRRSAARRRAREQAAALALPDHG